jgi:uncharacterized membrane protein
MIEAKRGAIQDKALLAFLVVAILGALAMLVYTIATSGTRESFTEFYILTLDGKAEDYPTEAVMGQETKVIIGIVNQERKEMSYRVEVTIDGIGNNEVGLVALDHEQQWLGEVGFTPAKAGSDQKVQFLLHKQGQADAYRSLHFWVYVKEPERRQK